MCMGGGHPPYEQNACIYQRSQSAVALPYTPYRQHFLARPSASCWQSHPAVSPLTAEPGSPRPQGCTPSVSPRISPAPSLLARVAGRWHCVLTAEAAGGSGDPGPRLSRPPALPGNSGGSASQPAQASPKPSPTPPARRSPLRRSPEQPTHPSSKIFSFPKSGAGGMREGSPV